MTVYRASDRANRWRYDFQHNGKRHTGYCAHPVTGVEARTERQARRIQEVIRERIARGEREASAPAGGVYSMAQLFADWLRHKEAEGHREMAAPRRHARELIAHFGAGVAVEDLTSQDIKEYRTWARAQPVTRQCGGRGQRRGRLVIKRDAKGQPVARSEATINRYLASFAAAVAHAAAERSIDPARVPAIKQLPEPERIPTPATPAEAAAVWNAASPHLRVAIGLACYLGLRGGEAVRVAPRHVNWHLRTLVLPDWQKGKRETVLPVSEHAFQVMRSAMETGAELWAAIEAGNDRARAVAAEWAIEAPADIPFVLWRNRGGLPRPIKRFSGAWNKARETAGVSRRFHDLRGYFVTELLGTSGGDIRTVQGLARHVSVSTTMAYAGLVDARSRAAVDGLAAFVSEPDSHTEVPHGGETNAGPAMEASAKILKIKTK